MLFRCSCGRFVGRKRDRKRGGGSIGRALRRDRELVMEIWGVWIGRRGRMLEDKCRVSRTFECCLLLLREREMGIELDDVGTGGQQ